MIILTESAQDFIKQSITQNDADSLGLRVAVYPDNENQCYNYGLGFDEARDDDIKIVENGITLLVGSKQRELIEDATIDYVEMEDGNMNLIVMNPNDPSYVPPKKDKKN
jgi:iron-sulfur cluster assembly protein